MQLQFIVFATLDEVGGVFVQTCVAAGTIIVHSASHQSLFFSFRPPTENQSRLMLAYYVKMSTNEELYN